MLSPIRTICMRVMKRSLDQVDVVSLYHVLELFSTKLLYIFCDKLFHQQVCDIQAFDVKGHKTFCPAGMKLHEMNYLLHTPFCCWVRT